MEYAGQEKRKDKRIKHPFTTRVRVYKKQLKPEVSIEWDMVTVRDLSAGGISFNYTNKIALGTVLEFNIILPSLSSPIHCLGEVSRTDERLSSRIDSVKIPVYGIAARFIEITKDNKQSIIELAKQFFSKQHNNE